MLKLVRWAYKLGVRNERRRIAAYLQAAQVPRYDRISEFERMIADAPREERDKIKQNDINTEVDRQIVRIIEDLFSAPDVYSRGESIMFPEEDEL